MYPWGETKGRTPRPTTYLRCSLSAHSPVCLLTVRWCQWMVLHGDVYHLELTSLLRVPHLPSQLFACFNPPPQKKYHKTARFGINFMDFKEALCLRGGGLYILGETHEFFGKKTKKKYSSHLVGAYCRCQIKYIELSTEFY